MDFFLFGGGGEELAHPLFLLHTAFDFEMVESCLSRSSKQRSVYFFSHSFQISCIICVSVVSPHGCFFPAFLMAPVHYAEEEEEEEEEEK